VPLSRAAISIIGIEASRPAKCDISDHVIQLTQRSPLAATKPKHGVPAPTN
jgi:hypothetical protein